MTVPSSQFRTGVLLMLLAWACFAVVDTGVKWLVLAGVPALMAAFARYIIAFAAALVAGWARGPLDWPVDRGTWVTLAGRGMLLGTTTIFNFIALKYLPLTVTSAILFSSPIIVCVLSIPLLGERIGPWRWFATLLGFGGVLIVLRPFGSEFHAASFLVLYNATALALFSILTRRISGSVSTATQQITMNGIGVLITLPFLPWVWTPPASWLHGALYLAAGIMAWAGHVAFSRAYTHGTASALMPFSYAFLIYLTFTSWLVFGDLPDATTIIGALVITGSGLLIWWREQGRNAA